MESLATSKWDSLHVRVFAVGRATLGAWWQFHYSRVGHWRFYYQSGDGARLELASGVFPLQSERLYFIPAGCPTFDTYCSDTAPVEQFFVHFDITGLPEIALNSLFAQPICLPSSPDLESRVRETIRDIDASQPTFLLQCRIKAILYEGLTLYLKTLLPSQVELCDQAVLRLAPILPALRYIEEHYTAPISNAVLASACSLSEDHFIRRFRRCTDQSPGQYTLQYRLRKVAQRLVFTQQGIEQIARETGFCHRSHLTKAFRGHFGVSPHTYRSNAA